MRYGVAALLAMGIVASTGHGQTRSFTFCPAGSPVRAFEIVFYDADFLFVTRGYGSAGDPGGNTTPGFFVHSKAQNRWIEIRDVSTKDGRFGKSRSDVPAEALRLGMISVSWDFTGLAAKEFAELPLMTSGSIALPDSIAYEPSTGRYMLDFMSSMRDIPVARTVLYIRRADLIDAFAKPPYPEPPDCRRE